MTKNQLLLKIKINWSQIYYKLFIIDNLKSFVFNDHVVILNICFYYYFGCDFSDCCPHLYCGKLKHISAAVSSAFLWVSLVYLGMEMIQPEKAFLKFNCWSNKAFKKYGDVIQIITSLFFMPINLRSVVRWIWNVKFNGTNKLDIFFSK